MNEFMPIRNNREAAKLLEEGWVIVRKSDLPRPVSNYEGVTGDVWTRIDDLPFSGHRDWLPGGGGPPPTPLTFDIGLIQIGMVVNLEPATETVIGGILEAPIDGSTYVRKDGLWEAQAGSSPLTFELGLTLTGTEVNLDPATDLLLGGITEPPPDDLLYVRTRSLAGISSWVPNAAGADFGTGLSLDTSLTPPLVNLTPAGDSPIFLGGVYVIDRVRNNTEGLELGIDGRLRAPLATDSLAGTILEPPPDDKGYVRRRTPAGDSAWVPPATVTTDYGIGLSLDDTVDPPMVHLQPAGYTEPGDSGKFLGGVYVKPATGLGLNSGLGELEGMLATPFTIGMIFDAPFDGKGYARTNGSWRETSSPPLASIPIAGYLPANLGAVYIVPDRALRVEADGALDVLPASPNQLGVIFDPPFDSGNPDVTYVRKWGSWEVAIESKPIRIAGNDPSELGIVYIVPQRGIGINPDGGLSIAPTTPTQVGGIVDAPFSDAANPIAYARQNAAWVEVADVQQNQYIPIGRSPLNGLDNGYDDVLKSKVIFVPLATDLLAGSIVEPPADNQVYVRSYDGTKGTWVSSSSSAIMIQDDPPDPVTTSPNTLWWDSNAGDLFVLYKDVDSTQWVQINTAVPANLLTDAPTDGKQYGRQSSAWTEIVTTTGGITQADADLRYLQLTGGTVSGNVVFSDISGTVLTFADQWGLNFAGPNKGFRITAPNNTANPGDKFVIDAVNDRADFMCPLFVQNAPVAMQSSIDDVMGHIGQLTTRLAALEGRIH